MCLSIGYSYIFTLSVLVRTIGYVTSLRKQSRNLLADHVDPANYLMYKKLDTCINLATKNWS
jgi:hypothetical protein